MAQVAGKYEFVKNENLEQYLKAFGVPEDRAQAMLADKPDTTITVNGNVIKAVSTGLNTQPHEWELGKEKAENLYGHDVKTVAALDGNKLTITSKNNEGLTFVREYVFSDAGLVVTLSGSKTGGVTAKRHYKRV